MIIDHPLLGPRDAAEFVYLGDASLIERPDPDSDNADHEFYHYHISEPTQRANTANFGIMSRATDLGSWLPATQPRMKSSMSKSRETSRWQQAAENEPAEQNSGRVGR